MCYIGSIEEIKHTMMELDEISKIPGMTDEKLNLIKNALVGVSIEKLKNDIQSDPERLFNDICRLLNKNSIKNEIISAITKEPTTIKIRLNSKRLSKLDKIELRTKILNLMDKYSITSYQYKTNTFTKNSIVSMGKLATSIGVDKNKIKNIVTQLLNDPGSDVYSVERRGIIMVRDGN